MIIDMRRLILLTLDVDSDVLTARSAISVTKEAIYFAHQTNPVKFIARHFPASEAFPCILQVCKNMHCKSFQSTYQESADYLHLSLVYITCLYVASDFKKAL